MSRINDDMEYKQLFFCVETNKNSDTDWKYIHSTVKRFYPSAEKSRKISVKPVYLESKTRYKEKKKEKEIKDREKSFQGKTFVIYCIDMDDYDNNPNTKNQFDVIKSYCEANSYDFVFFKKDIEDVYLGEQIRDNDKVKRAAQFTKNKEILTVSEDNLRQDSMKDHCSNILNILDKYLIQY